jgi:hypothetical protein
MSGLLDFVQGASNAAAGTVAGPIDLINMGLLGVGLPMPNNPFGGSQWMRERGLMRDPENRTAGLLGESVGGILPIVAAARAPQIAAGLLQAGDNLRAPAPFNAATRGQGGAIVYHGSPHRFDKFDSSKIGTGEGAQAYGHGLYLADAPEVAKTYATGGGGFVSTQGRQNVYFDGKWLQSFSDKKSAEGLAKYVMTQSAAGNTIDEKISALSKIGRPDAAEWLQKNATRFTSSSGNLYKVDLPDEHIARMLDWDKPWSQQPEAVRKAVDVSALEKFYNTKDLPTSQVLYHMNQNKTPAQSAEYLRAQGIPGVRYLDGGSRTAGGGTSNYVVFAGNEGLLKILSRE